jgi:hypothetical protein
VTTIQSDNLANGQLAENGLLKSLVLKNENCFIEGNAGKPVD